MDSRTEVLKSSPASSSTLACQRILKRTHKKCQEKKNENQMDQIDTNGTREKLSPIINIEKLRVNNL